MAETKNTKKTTKVTENTKAKTPKTKEVKAPKNEEKKNVVLTVSIDEIAKMYEEAGIKNYNPTAKGNYRIMGNKSGSSLNLRKTQYIIFSTDVDYEALKEAKIEGVELIEKGNSQDKSRPQKVVIQAVDTLKKALKVYATNPVNQVVKV